MEDMWKVPGRVKPVPLDYDSIMADEFAIPPLAKKEAEKASNGAAKPANLKDQQELSAKDNLELFLDRYGRLKTKVAK